MKQKLVYGFMISATLIGMSLALGKNEAIGLQCPEREGHKSLYICKFDNTVKDKCKCVYEPIYNKVWQCEEK